MRLIINCLVVFLFNTFCSVAQSPCSNVTNTISNQSPNCPDQYIGTQTAGVVKISLTAVISSNTHVFTTVGETEGDTFLSLYDSSNTLISSNDDAPNCSGCKQSTITYGGFSSGGAVSGLYLILSKPGCIELDFSTNLKFSARNSYNSEPQITSPVEFIQCVGNKVQFTYAANTTSVASPWSSLTPSIVSINPTSGLAEFLTTGLAQIQLEGKSSCTVVNKYLVKGSPTSSIQPQ
jgi:hypothetical protein